jgi:hypothetical protein
MKYKSVLLLIGVIVAILLAGALYLKNSIFLEQHGAQLTDSEYIASAKNTPETKSFLGRYPQASIEVDRSGKLVVDFRAGAPIDPDTHYIRLRVFIDPRSNQPTDKFIDCSGQLVEANLIEYLRTERCLQ